ncbi:cobaltochelatase subunit CobN [Prosthecochloris sp. N3]|uniref:Cobaltochelatase subunit CobN n=1 Tax=Prosthecochloris ethylica TaxID=2743976 RepID=A0ABR9XTS9_9CHLB|nr:cobaltochelatase subunit CobN [Prosthecochloris ethylica]MBF0587114.1 cobaltochelatase subunit CobN [Prosthecochloris ethylica]MBF0637416.1 cobaltochelatase subunit CobN [Prosthecochloris ethylica]NUK48056.1 cobaltochelatase subunit CobN [Prosthecochloris ethylica]
MKHFSLCYFTTSHSEVPSFSAGVRQYMAGGGSLDVHARVRSQLSSPVQIDEFARLAASSDVMIVRLMGGKASFPAFDAFFTACEERKSAGEKTPLLIIHAAGGDDEALELARDHSALFGTKDGETMQRYLLNGGRANFSNMLVFLHNVLFGSSYAPEPPRKLPHEGVYHPDYPAYDDLEGYLEKHVDPSKPTVGLWFYQSYYVDGDLAAYDSLIREIERNGANVIAVFHLRYRDAMRKNRGSDYVADTFFRDSEGNSRIDVLINPLMFSLTLNSPDYRDILPGLDVPFLQAMTTFQSYEEWKKSVQGLGTMEVSFSAAQPEFDGALIGVPFATREHAGTDPLTGAELMKIMPVEERVRKLAALALRWARLRHTPNSEKRIAIVFHHYPPRNDRIGCAVGLDSFESVRLLLERMKEEGYGIERAYEHGDELARELLDGMTCDQRWLLPDQMAERCEASAEPAQYHPWNEALPETARQHMSEAWGEMPGELFVHDGRLLFPGTVNGNVFITIQPPRGHLERQDQLVHDPDIPPPHHYLAHYRWMRDVFGADAVMHVGKHGSLEWLPGKALGLSEECYPDLAIMDLPNIYPYIINDPSEGTQAKRRSNCCIVDHLTPVFTNADLYEEMAALENLLGNYAEARRSDPAKLDVLRPMIWDALVEADLDKDTGYDRETAMADFEHFLEDLHSYLDEVADTMIADGLHTLGLSPEGDRLVELVVQMTRLEQGGVPSLRESILRACGYDLDDLNQNKGRPVYGPEGKTGGQVIREAHESALEMVRMLSAEGFRADAVDMVRQAMPGLVTADVIEGLRYICSDLVPRIRQVSDEIDSSLKGFSGRFVEAGPSGAPTRGQADILPTGRNFYSVDPQKIPTPAAWKVGMSLGDALVERYLEEHGDYPRSIGIILFGGATMRSGGDDLAEILYLMGVRPVWKKGSGYVSGLEIIPSSELKWPRLDIMPRISGFFRDAFPLLVERIDDAVKMVAALNEPPEINLIRRNVLADVEAYRKEGMSEDEALREATFRVFGCPPGTYGAGVEELIESKNWESQDDLAENYVRYSSHAYGRGSYGRQKPATFRKVLSRLDATVKNEDSREYDMFSCTDYYNYYGGLITAAKQERGELPFALVGDSSDPERVKVRTTFEEAKHIFRSRLLNPKWLEGLKRHGYKGAGDISKMMDVILGWDATAEVVEDWMYERVAGKYVLDEEMKRWMQEVNPYARQNILDKLLEAISRGMWNATEEMKQRLQEEYLETEGEIEEINE